MSRRPPVVDRYLDRVVAGVSDRVVRALDPVIRTQVADRLHDDLRAEMVELARMLRQQGDAADEVAEILGRTLARLSAEVDDLAVAVARLKAAEADAGAVGPG